MEGAGPADDEEAVVALLEDLNGGFAAGEDGGEGGGWSGDLGGEELGWDERVVAED